MITAAVAASLAAMPAHAASEAKDADWHLDLRYRLESVDQAGFAEDALASTLRTRFGLRTSEWNGWHGMIEFEDSRPVLLPDDYNSTKNGNTTYPVVADPKDTELNQLYAGYRFDEGSFKLGRQRINIDNQRFVGAVGFRQNEQTFDAATLDMGLGDKSRLLASVVTRANRIFGAHHPNPALANTDMQTLFTDYSVDMGMAKLGAYVHLVDFDNTPAASHRNVGLRASGKPGSFDWRVEYANQAEYADGSSAIDADYYRLDAGHDVGGIHVGFAYEVLGGDGSYAFQTPFATLHKFNGFTDKFLVTPSNGLVDTMLTAKGKVGDWTIGGQWHQFAADNVSVDYGSEINMFAKTSFENGLDFSVKLADYSADTYSADTTKIWVTLHAAF